MKLHRLFLLRKFFIFALHSPSSIAKMVPAKYKSRGPDPELFPSNLKSTASLSGAFVGRMKMSFDVLLILLPVEHSYQRNQGEAADRSHHIKHCWQCQPFFNLSFCMCSIRRLLFLFYFLVWVSIHTTSKISMLNLVHCHFIQ